MKIRTSEEVYGPREDSFLLQRIVADICISRKPKKVLELGTGTGIQAITAKLSGAKDVLAVDINPKAVSLAKRNAKLNNANIVVKQSDLFSKVRGKFDLIIFNPPYLPLEPPLDVQWSGGREFIEAFLEEAELYLKKNGSIVFVFSSLSPIRTKHKKLAREKMPDGEKIYVAEV